MATVEQLKEEIAQADAEIARLKPAYEAAKTAATQAQADLDAFQARPGNLSFGTYSKTKSYAAANPNDPVAQKAAQDAQATWNAQQSEYLPLLRARDDTAAAQVEANKPIVAADEKAAQADLAIAKIDPTQASQDARAALAEQEGTPTPKAPVEDANATTPASETGKQSPPEVIRTTVEEGVTTEYLSDGTVRVTSDDGTVSNYNEDLTPKTVEEDSTNPSKEDADTEDKYKNQSATDPGPPAEDDGSDPYVSNGQTTIPTGDNSLPKGGVSTKTSTPPARAEWPDAKDVRAILKVPATYLNGITDPGKVLAPFGGIVFPYTPSISFSHDASYTGVNPTHSNYTQYFYKNSAVSAISLNAKFTVQNEDDAIILVGVLTLLRALTKMKFGPDKDAGAPPPICRFSAYGNYMLSNVPVTIASFKHDLPEGVDYFQTGNRFKTHGLNFVPILSTISLTLNPTYSRSEMMRAGVSTALTGKAQKSGFL